jgi:hypothetical protein
VGDVPETERSFMVQHLAPSHQPRGANDSLLSNALPSKQASKQLLALNIVPFLVQCLMVQIITGY